MRIPFGKYKGFDLEELPDEYLLWVYQNCTHISPKLRAAVSEELDERGYAGEEAKRNQGEGVEPDSQPLSPMIGVLMPRHHARLFEVLVEHGYKQLAKRFHPDAGGDPEQMQALNDLIAALRVELAVALRRR